MEVLARKISECVKICDKGPWMLPELDMRPSGREEGEVLVIGVGGSTLRLTHVTVSTEHCESEELVRMSIGDEVKQGELFSWIAECIVPALDKWVSTHSKNSTPLVCVSWSFPLLNGNILSMGKAFSSKYCGQNALQLFNGSFPSRYRIESITHDGSSSLIAGMYEIPRCKMALTLGTGVNVNVEDADGVIINTEISMLGRPDTTPGIELYHEEWDVSGPIADFQPFEVKIGGPYIAQMASQALGEEISTLDVWSILSDKDDDRYDIANRIVKRAASLVAAAIYGLTTPNKPADLDNKLEPITVVYTGGVVFEPEFRSRLEQQLQKLSAKFGFSIALVPQKYGSEIGAAISALTTAA